MMKKAAKMILSAVLALSIFFALCSCGEKRLERMWSLSGSNMEDIRPDALPKNAEESESGSLHLDDTDMSFSAEYSYGYEAKTDISIIRYKKVYEYKGTYEVDGSDITFTVNSKIVKENGVEIDESTEVRTINTSVDEHEYLPFRIDELDLEYEPFMRDNP